MHGLGLSGVSINGTELGEEAVGDRRGRRKRRKSKCRSKTRANRPRTGSASRSRSAAPKLQGTIESIGAGETGSASILLTPTPSGEVTLEVKVEPVPGEQVSENNEASYTVVFE